MNSKIIAAAIAVLVIAGAVFLFTRNNQPTEEVASETNTASMESEASVETASIKSLIESGRNQKCTFKTVDNGSESEGIVYAADGKMRGDFTIKADATTMISHMIYDGTTGYVWIDGQANGFKMALDAESQVDMSQNQAMDPNRNFEFNCERWSADNSKFEQPAGVTFTEMPTIPVDANAGAAGSVNSKEVQQAVCNNLPEPAKSSCLSALN